MLLSTFLCIDLTSNWLLPITCRQSLKKFSYIQIVKKPAFSTLESTFSYIICNVIRLHSSFTIVPPSLARCKVVSCCSFCYKENPVRFASLQHIARGSIEHSLNFYLLYSNLINLTRILYKELFLFKRWDSSKVYNLRVRKLLDIVKSNIMLS